MELYDPMINRICQLERGHAALHFPYRPDKAWPENEDYECIFQKETGLTLGQTPSCGCNMICATTDPSFFHGDETVVIGPDLGKIKGNASFVRIVLLLTEEILPEENSSEEILPEGADSKQAKLKAAAEMPQAAAEATNAVGEMPQAAAEATQATAEATNAVGEMPQAAAEATKAAAESKYPAITEAGKKQNSARVRSTEQAFRILQQMDFVKYHIFPKGYMVRVSGQSAAEQVRVSKKALAKGISFEKIGNTYLKHYKENPKVLQAKVIFITAEDMGYAELKNMAGQAESIRNSLSVIMKGIAADCGSCSIREICNEIEGLREVHFGKNAEEKNPE